MSPCSTSAMPLLNGIEATRQIVRRAPSVRVLILSMHSDQAYVTQAVQAGARGYLLKESAGSELIEAIAAVAAGKTFFSPPLRRSSSTTTCASCTDRGITDRYDALSEREREVLQLVAEGRSSKEIATCCPSALPLLRLIGHTFCRSWAFAIRPRSFVTRPTRHRSVTITRLRRTNTGNTG